MTPYDTKRVIARAKMNAARAEARAAGHAVGHRKGYRIGLKEGRAEIEDARKAEFSAGSRATLAALYRNCDHASMLWIGQILMGPEFKTSDPAEIEARQIVLARALDFQARALAQ